MSKHRLFGARAAEAITIVEPSALRAYRRKARVALFVCTGSGALLGAVVAAPFRHPMVGAVAGAIAGAVAGVLTGALMVAWPVLRSIWHWAAEIAIGLGMVAGVVALASVTRPWVAAALLLAVAGVVVAVGPARRFVTAWVWCALVRHRLRLCFTEFIKASNRVAPTRLPLILTARPTLAGERVWLWLRPGLDLSDLDQRMPKLAVACWASEVRVIRSTRFAALVRVDITRRDPLSTVVPSWLAGRIPTQRDTSATSTVVPVDGLDLPDIPEPPPQTRPRAA